MLIKFHSEESAEFVMLADTADQLLAMMGHGGSTEGSISGEALGSALNRLSSAITRNEEQAGVSGRMNKTPTTGTRRMTMNPKL